MSTPSLMKINTGTVSPPSNGTSLSPGSRRAAMSASSSHSPKGTKVVSNSTNKVTNSSHIQRNGSAKVPNLKISTISGKVTNMKSTMSFTGDNSKTVVTGPIPIQQSRPNLKTTARKSMTPQAGPHRNNLSVVNHVTAMKTPPKKAATSRETESRFDDTDTEIEESPKKQSPVPSRSNQRLVPETPSPERVQELEPRQSIPTISTSLNKAAVENSHVAHKRPIQDPPKKLSEIRPTKVSRLSNSIVASTLPMASKPDHDSDSINKRVSNMNNNQPVPPSPLKAPSAATAITSASKPPSSNYNDWSIDDVVNYLIKVDETFDDPKIREKFHEHVSLICLHVCIRHLFFILQEIDGRAFVLLTFEMMKNYMELKLGPMLKILDIIAKLKKGQVIG